MLVVSFFSRFLYDGRSVLLTNDDDVALCVRYRIHSHSGLILPLIQIDLGCYREICEYGVMHTLRTHQTCVWILVTLFANDMLSSQHRTSFFLSFFLSFFFLLNPSTWLLRYTIRSTLLLLTYFIVIGQKYCTCFRYKTSHRLFDLIFRHSSLVSHHLSHIIKITTIGID